MESKHARPFNQHDICLYIAALLSREIVHKPIYHMYIKQMTKYLKHSASEKLFSKIYFPFLTLGRGISIDEALLLWKGRLSWKQFIRTKRNIFGIKTFIIVDACAGYDWNSIIYMGDGTMVKQDLDFTYHAKNIVMSLTEDVLGEGRCIYVDNWM